MRPMDRRSKRRGQDPSNGTEMGLTKGATVPSAAPYCGVVDQAVWSSTVALPAFLLTDSIPLIAAALLS